MKSIIYCFLLICCSFMIFSCTSQQQIDQMLITTSSPEARELYIQGRVKADNIEFTAAMMLFDQALEEDPDFAMAHLQQALAGGSLEERREHLSKAVDLVDKVSPGEAKFILYYKALFDGDGAIKACESRFKKAEDQNLVQYKISSMNIAGFILAENGEFEKATSYYDKAVEIIETAEMEDVVRKGFDFNAGVNHCYMLTNLNQLDEATEEGQKCLSIAEKRQNPGENQFIHGRLGALEIKKGNFKQALEHLNKADPQSPYNWYQMALAYEGMDMKDKANELFTQVANQNEVRLDLILVRQKAKENL